MATTVSTGKLLHEPGSDPLLHNLLVEGRNLDLFYGPQFLSDHLPMALTSLRRLGATDEQLRSFRAKYASRLEPPRFEVKPLKGDPWINSRGKIHHYPALRQWFDATLETHGRDDVLSHWIPRLLPAAGVDAFHPLIRTALGVESGSNAELACGLAYWVGSFKALPMDDGPRIDLTAAEAFDRLRQSDALSFSKGLSGMFGEQLESLAAQPHFQQLVRWRGPRINLMELAAESARIYMGCGHFFALHMVTGTQAVHCLAPWAGDPDKVIDTLWLNLAAAFLIIRRPAAVSFHDQGEPLPERSAVLDAALAHHDEHIAKLAYSTYREYETWGRAEHRALITRIATGNVDLNFGA